jgi:hypothetical protein
LFGAVLCWPALVNRQAFFFPDTTTYVKGAATGLMKFTHRSSHWIEPKTAMPAASPASGPTLAPAVDEFESSPEKKGVLAGRSVYYGGFLLAAYELGTLWTPIVLQGLLAVAVIALALRASRAHVAPLPSWRRSLAYLAVLGLGTSLPFFVSMLMPDLLTGLAILAGATLLAFATTRAARIGGFAVLSFATLSHSSNVLVLAGMIAAFAALTYALHRSVRRALVDAALVVATIVVGLAGDAAFGAVVRHTTGMAPIRPPFLMARLIADGPGADWMRDHCADSTYVVCRYVAHAGEVSSDEFLWSHDVAHGGVFTVANKDERAALSAEQLPFFKDVLFTYPGRVLLDAARNFGSQLTKAGLDEFNYRKEDLAQIASRIPSRDAVDLQATRAAAQDFPATFFANLQLLVLAASAVTVLHWFARGWSAARSDFRLFVALVIAGLAVNSLVCGVLSTPHDRYQARALWLLPLIALMCWNARHAGSGADVATK